MKNILCYLLTFFLFSCEAVDWHTTLEQNDNAQQILDQLNDPELKKGKIFVLSRHKNDVAIKIRVNEEVFIIRREEIQSFELKEGNNSLFTYLVAFGDEVGNCNRESYVFNTKDFEDDETHYFILMEGPGPIFTCFRDVHVKEEAFHYKKENPRSRWKEGWIINY
ncbi:hypothetical protein OAD25_01635 [Gammaproteobacteria bacterium]|jgi:hypothetical protein|nr:hypothetical protein [Gammaproteobacteria bacterium]MDB9898360.1 hypothetical protein [Gammaproteobacteria bacterium]